MPNTGYFWCQRHFHKIGDELTKKTQSKSKNLDGILDWIEYDKFENVEYLAKGEFGTIFKAMWKDGLLRDEILKIVNGKGMEKQKFL